MVKCSKGKTAAVSDIDYARVSAQKWYAKRGHGNVWYAYNRFGEGMHRYILRLKGSAKVVDHIDGNGLNNQRENLRACTQAENNANARVRSPLKRHFRGIQPVRGGGWQAVINYRGEEFLGDPREQREDAARDYDKFKIMFYGEYACTNETQRLYDLTPEEFAKECICKVTR